MWMAGQAPAHDEERQQLSIVRPYCFAARYCFARILPSSTAG